MNCTCIAKINEKLKDQNLKLADSNFALRMPEFETVFLIKTEWIDVNKAPKGKKKKAPSIFAAHCPYCGKKAIRKEKNETH